MNIYTLLVALIVIGIIWGGLIFFIMKAINFEKKKMNQYGKESNSISK